MKDILEKLALLESEKPKAALLNKKFSSFRDMEQLQGDAKITTAHKPVQMGDKQKGLTGKLVGTSEAVETTVEDLVAQLGSEFKSQFLGDKKKPKKDRDLANAPADREIGKKKPANDIHVKEGALNEVEQMLGNMGNEVDEGLGDDERRAFKRQELQHELGHEKNNIQVTINGRPWKVFAGRGTADSTEEYRHLQSMKAWAQKKSAATGKKWDVYLTGSPADVNEDAVADFLARGGQIQVGKPSRGPRRPGTSFGSKHIGTGRGGKASNQSGKSANTGPNAKPVVAAESVEMSTAGPMGSMPTDNVPQVQHVTEDWGSSDWHPVMKGMWDVIDRHYGGRANPESIEDAAQNAAEFYYDDMGYDSVEDAKDRIIGMFLRRPDGIGRKQDKSPEQELEEAGVVPAPATAPASPEAAGLQGQLNVKQLASILPGIDPRALGMAIATLKTGNEPSMAQQKALAGAFAALIKADPQATSKAMAVLKKVSAEPAPTPANAKVAAPAVKPAVGTPPAPAATKPVGTPAAAPAAGTVPAEESMDYIKENKRK